MTLTQSLFRDSCDETQSSGTNRSLSTPRTEGLNIVSCNIEGVKSNIVYFQNLCKEHDSICIQDHWLWDFQKHEIQNMAADKDFHIMCPDSTGPLSGFRLPRGQGGVSILWPLQWSSKVKKKLNEGNERIICVEISGKEKHCIINVYLPTNNSSVNSHVEYPECLDILDNLICKYINSHKIILCGDFNGTLLSARPYNNHDLLLQNFVKEQELTFKPTNDHTFYHHSGSSSSHIDYILSTDSQCMTKYTVSVKDCENTSSHVKISAFILTQFEMHTISSQLKTNKTTKKLQWEKIDKHRYT